jgi:hypothetical protein
MVPLPTAIKPVVVSDLGMNSGGEAVLSKEDNHHGGEESNTSSKDNTGYDSPANHGWGGGSHRRGRQEHQEHQWSWRIFVPVATVGRKGINHPMPLE